MPDIELVIKIPEEDYKRGTVMASAIRNGIPLPKGHGKLIDGDALHKEFDERGMSWEAKLIDYAETVIPADKEN